MYRTAERVALPLHLSLLLAQQPARVGLGAHDDTLKSAALRLQQLHVRRGRLHGVLQRRSPPRLLLVDVLHALLQLLVLQRATAGKRLNPLLLDLARTPLLLNGLRTLQQPRLGLLDTRGLRAQLLLRMGPQGAHVRVQRLQRRARILPGRTDALLQIRAVAGRVLEAAAPRLLLLLELRPQLHHLKLQQVLRAAALGSLLRQ
mmetsp:Transcript_8031/g.18831  ORF Transcript_8031/g.18831 Transcript_8031/m.18831 type:complete len:203 (-) Transcript_8031:207-815(-)